jgi:hypothetical protein
MEVARDMTLSLQTASLTEPILFPKHVYPEDGGSMFLRNVDIHPQENTASQPRTQESEQSRLCSGDITLNVAVDWLAHVNVPP